MIDKIDRNRSVSEKIGIEKTQKREEKAPNPSNVELFKTAIGTKKAKDPDITGGKKEDLDVHGNKKENFDIISGKKENLEPPTGKKIGFENLSDKKINSGKIDQEDKQLDKFSTKKTDLNQFIKVTNDQKTGKVSTVGKNKDGMHVSSETIQKHFQEKANFDTSQKKQFFQEALKNETVLKDTAEASSKKDVLLDENVSQLDTKKALSQDVKNQSIQKSGEKILSAIQGKDVDQLKMRKVENDALMKGLLAGIQHSGLAQNFATPPAPQMNTIQPPVNRQEIIQQVEKISDYISAQLNNAGETKSITIKFKDDVLPGATLTINKSDDDSFDLNFKFVNKDSEKLVSENKSTLLESLNKNTQGGKFQVRMDEEAK